MSSRLRLVTLSLAALAATTMLSPPARSATLSTYAGPTCSGSYIYVLPDLPVASSTASSSSSSSSSSSVPFSSGHASSGSRPQRTSSVSLTNLDGTNAAAITVCGYASGAFIGGSGVALPANNALVAIDPTPTTTSATTIGLTTLLGGASVTTYTTISVVIASDRPLALGGASGSIRDGVRASGGSVATADLAFANAGEVASGAGVLFLANPTASAVSYTVTFFKADGTLVATSAAGSVAAYQGARVAISSLTDSAGTALTLTGAEIVHVKTASGVLGGTLFKGNLASGYFGSTQGTYSPY
jgi:hypothetical protein